MKVETPRNSDAKQRIISASLSLFSRKGFDATSVNEIAKEAKVTKALIYYYFRSKDEILDHLIQTMLGDWALIARDFIGKNIVQMINDGRLDIKPDGPRFIDEAAMSDFLENSMTFFRRMLDLDLGSRSILRIMMLESLKMSDHHNELLNLMDMRARTADNLLFKAIAEADEQFVVSKGIVLFEFFFIIIPFVCFATYYDDCREVSGLSDKELEETFLRSVRVVLRSMISGSDILYAENKPDPAKLKG
jgi:AcrR family transcriptional regulator